jgi:hypothetical protein
MWMTVLSRGGIHRDDECRSVVNEEMSALLHGEGAKRERHTRSVPPTRRLRMRQGVVTIAKHSVIELTQSTCWQNIRHDFVM